MRYCHLSICKILVRSTSLSISHLHTHWIVRELFIYEASLINKAAADPLKENYRFLLWVDIRVCFYPWLEQYKVLSGVGVGRVYVQMKYMVIIKYPQSISHITDHKF